jgi:hypothetical protein
MESNGVLVVGSDSIFGIYSYIAGNYEFELSVGQVFKGRVTRILFLFFQINS